MSDNLISAGFHYFSDASDEAAVLYLHSIYDDGRIDVN